MTSERLFNCFIHPQKLLYPQNKFLATPLMDHRALIYKRFSTVKVDILLFKCRWRHCWRAATCGQL